MGVGHDAGYAPFLDEMIRDDATRQRITVLEGVATVPELIATGVSLVKLDNNLFRTEKMLMRSPKPRTAAPAQATPPVPAPMPTPPATIVRTSSPAVSVSSSSAGNGQSWANVTGSGTPPPQITIPLSFPKQAPRGQKAQLAHQQQMLSKEPAQYQTIPPELPDWVPGERGLDEPITVNVNVYETVKKRKESDKLCNNHFLRGPCAKGDNCFFVHDYKPTDAELKAIAVLARQNPCTLGQYCEKEDCIYGHHVSSHWLKLPAIMLTSSLSALASRRMPARILSAALTRISILPARNLTRKRPRLIKVTSICFAVCSFINHLSIL